MPNTLAPPPFEKKICAADALPAILANVARPLIFTNGVFDILHRGHVTYLAQARTLGAFLIVGVNSDASVRTLNKGPERPINSENDRMAILAALASVDLVVSFSESTPVQLIEKIRPDIYVKGGDYNIQLLEETKKVRSWGGEAVAIPFIHSRSTTQLLGKIRTT